MVFTVGSILKYRGSETDRGMDTAAIFGARRDGGL
jgi:hypothetical protein